ncbi:MAG: 5-oxoprolinase [Candidatus Xenobia bacterium]
MSLVGVDTGGTFTDLVLFQDGQLHLCKVSTTRPSAAPGVLRGLARLNPRPGFELALGTTVGTNAFLERQGARTAFITTEGFADLLELARGTRPDLYALVPRREEPLTRLTFEVKERVSAEGQVLEPLVLDDELPDRLRALKVESVAVCLLFSFLRPEHEKTLGQLLQDFPVSLSHQVCGEMREYERASTTVLNAYLQPVLARYLHELDRELEPLGCKQFFVVHSAGAVMSAGEAAERAVAAVLSGPAAGVHGAFEVARQAGFDQIVTLDMGGTSTDVSLCPGQVAYTAEGELEGMPVRQLMIDVHTVGAGGGSLAWLDAGGALRVGPRSAGSDPGPAAYGKGSAPTVTDALLVLDRMPTELAGGEIELDAARSHQALAGLGLGPPEEAAEAVLAVAEAHMERALRVISLERGYDPGRFTLVPYGGAGPLFAASLAEKLAMQRVLVPLYPGVLSALGALVAPWMREFALSRQQPLEQATMEACQPHYAELEERARQAMGQKLRFERLVDLRYRGQGFELTVPFRGDLRAAFQRRHKRRYGYARPEHPLELVTLRLRATRPRPRPRFLALPARERLLRGTTFRRSELVPGDRFTGPARIEQLDCTTYLPAGWQARVDPHLNLVLERS